MHKETGCASELDYNEQTSWLFLKFLDGMEQDKAMEEAMEKLTPLLRIKFHGAIADAVADLGRPEEIGRVFSGFQKYLYQQAPLGVSWFLVWTDRRLIAITVFSRISDNVF